MIFLSLICRAIYANYEVLCNAFATKLIDVSKTDIYRVKASEIDKPIFESFLKEQNIYDMYKFTERYERLGNLIELEHDLAELKQRDEKDSKVI